MSRSPPDFDGRAGTDRIRRFVDVDTLTNVTALLMLVALGALKDLGWVFALAAAVAVNTAVLIWSRRPIAAGRADRGVIAVALSTWMVAAFVTAIVPFVAPVMAMTALLPAVLALPYVSRGQLAWIIVATTLTAAIIGVEARFSDFSGVETAFPGWVPDVILIVTLPLTTAVVVLLVWHNSASLNDALDRSHDLNEALVQSRARLAAARDLERQRIERDLHDGTQQQLVAIALNLHLAETGCRSDPEKAAQILHGAQDQLESAIGDLRNLARGIYPSILTDHGLGEALGAVCARVGAAIEVSVDQSLGRFPPPVEAAAYFCCLEAVNNAIKHNDRSIPIRVDVRRTADQGLSFDVADDGQGFEVDGAHAGAGLTNMADRVGAIGGVLTLTSRLGAGTSVHGDVPADGR